MNKLLMLGAMVGLGVGVAKYMKKKHQGSESSNSENMTQQQTAA